MLPMYKCEYIRDGGKVDNQVVDKQKGSLLMLANERGGGGKQLEYLKLVQNEWVKVSVCGQAR